jgi:hypothetical protein
MSAADIALHILGIVARCRRLAIGAVVVEGMDWADGEFGYTMVCQRHPTRRAKSDRYSTRSIHLLDSVRVLPMPGLSVSAAARSSASNVKTALLSQAWQSFGTEKRPSSLGGPLFFARQCRQLLSTEL